MVASDARFASHTVEAVGGLSSIASKRGRARSGWTPLPRGAFGHLEYPTPPVRLHDTTVRRHWEQARKVNIDGADIVLDPADPLGDASWAKQRLGRATQALPNGFCGLPVQKNCPHANACLTCPMFITTAEFLPQHRQQHQQILQIITAAEARGQTRLTQMNREVADNLEKIITALENKQPQEVADAS